MISSLTSLSFHLLTYKTFIKSLQWRLQTNGNKGFSRPGCIRSCTGIPPHAWRAGSPPRTPTPGSRDPIIITAYCCPTAALGGCGEGWATAAMGSSHGSHMACERQFHFLSAKLNKDAWFMGFQDPHDSDFYMSTNTHLPSSQGVMEALAGMALALTISPKCQLLFFKDFKCFCFQAWLYTF